MGDSGSKGNMHPPNIGQGDESQRLDLTLKYFGPRTDLLACAMLEVQF